MNKKEKYMLGSNYFCPIIQNFSRFFEHVNKILYVMLLCCSFSVCCTKESIPAKLVSKLIPKVQYWCACNSYLGWENCRSAVEKW